MKRRATDVEVFMVSSEEISFICAWRSFGKIRGISGGYMLNAILKKSDHFDHTDKAEPFTVQHRRPDLEVCAGTQSLEQLSK